MPLSADLFQKNICFHLVHLLSSFIDKLLSRCQRWWCVENSSFFASKKRMSENDHNYIQKCIDFMIVIVIVIVIVIKIRWFHDCHRFHTNMHTASYWYAWDRKIELNGISLNADLFQKDFCFHVDNFYIRIQ